MIIFLLKILILIIIRNKQRAMRIFPCEVLSVMRDKSSFQSHINLYQQERSNSHGKRQ